MSVRSWRQQSAAFVVPVALASGCLLVAPPEDLPAAGTSGQGAQGSGGSSAGHPSADTGGFGASSMLTGGQGGEPNPEGGSPGNAGSGTGETGASGGTGGSRAGTGGTHASGGTGGTVVAMAGAGEGGAPGCTTNTECTDAAHEPSLCRPSDHTCVALKTNECPVVYGDATDPNALYIASFAVLSQDNPSDSDIYWAEQLAVKEINDAGGLPGGPNGASRSLVLIVCTNDGVAVPGAVSNSMTHIAEELELPALIAMLQPDDLTSALLQEQDKKLFFLNPVATLRRLTDAKTTGGRVWTLLGQPSDYAPAYHLLLSDLEKQIRSEQALVPSDEIKVALVTTTDAFNTDLRFYVYQSLVFNGQAAANESDAGNYKEYTLDPTAAPTQSMLDDLIAFAPDVIVSTASDVMTATSGVLASVESGWSSSKPHPYYLLSPYNATSDAQNTIFTVIHGELTGEPAAARRFLGVNAAPADDLTLENGYETRYDYAFPDAPSTAAPNTDNYYDAVYYLAYAMAAGDSLTGPGIANGMARLITGEPHDDGPTDIPNVLAALAAGKSIALGSTLGPPDFDTTTGVRPVTPGVFCFAYNGFPASYPNALRYDPDNDTFTGDYPCIDNFPPP